MDVVIYFLEILRELVALNNFNGAMEILSALQNSVIDRLHVTWQVSGYNDLVKSICR